MGEIFDCDSKTFYAPQKGGERNTGLEWVEMRDRNTGGMDWREETDFIGSGAHQFLDRGFVVDVVEDQKLRHEVEEGPGY